VSAWKQKDAIVRLRQHLIAGAAYTEQEMDAVDESISQEIEEAVRFAENSPDPAPKSYKDYLFA
jgi:pyruvate dehydrogenase E1 component alpha subunit